MLRPSRLPPRQVAYFVPDIETAARQHNALFGSGPFFVARHVELASSVHRGTAHPFDHSSAYGQWGDVMIEFLQQHDHTPSACHDLYPVGSNRYGLHHVSTFVKDIDDAVADYRKAGMDLAQDSLTKSGVRFAFVDGGQLLGHMLELYEPGETLLGFFDMVEAAARDWDGVNLIHELGG